MTTWHSAVARQLGLGFQWRGDDGALLYYAVIRQGTACDTAGSGYRPLADAIAYLEVLWDTVYCKVGQKQRKPRAAKVNAETAWIAALPDDQILADVVAALTTRAPAPGGHRGYDLAAYRSRRMPP